VWWRLECVELQYVELEECFELEEFKLRVTERVRLELEELELGKSHHGQGSRSSALPFGICSVTVLSRSCEAIGNMAILSSLLADPVLMNSVIHQVVEAQGVVVWPCRFNRLSRGPPRRWLDRCGDT